MSHIVTEPPEGVTYPLGNFERRSAHLIGRQFTVQLEGDRPPVSVTFTKASFADLEEPRFETPSNRQLNLAIARLSRDLMHHECFTSSYPAREFRIEVEGSVIMATFIAFSGESLSTNTIEPAGDSDCHRLILTLANARPLS